jgi:hypothetical protein
MMDCITLGASITIKATMSAIIIDISDITTRMRSSLHFLFLRKNIAVIDKTNAAVLNIPKHAHPMLIAYMYSSHRAYVTLEKYSKLKSINGRTPKL